MICELVEIIMKEFNLSFNNNELEN